MNLKNNLMSQSTLFLNIDPNITDDRVWEHQEVARKYFKKIIVRHTTQGNFKMAVLWLWFTMPSSEQYVMHLQDDWTLQKQVDMLQMRNEMSDLVHSVNLRAYENSNKFYMAHCLHKVSFCKKLISKMNTTSNPQFEARRIETDVRGFKQYPKQVVIKDIGRQYLHKKGMSRNSQNCQKFISHIKKA